MTKFQYIGILGCTASLVSGCEKPRQGGGGPTSISESSQLSEQALLLRDLGSTFDPIKGDQSPAIDRLIEIGESSVDECLKIFSQENDELRLLHAQRVIEGYTIRRFGFVPGRGWSKSSSAQWKSFWDSLGHLNYKDSIENRRAAISGWLNWRMKLPPLPNENN